MAAGKFPASPIPNSARENIKPKTDTGTAVNPIKPRMPTKKSPIGIAQACTIAPIDQTTIAQAYPRFVPS